jgi:hypothetical protein
MSNKGPAILAVRLLGRWTELARRHVPLGAGCACGPGLPGVQLGDFEAQLLDYLRSRHGGISAGGVAELLRPIAKGESVVPRAEQEALLAELERTLDSFEEAHRGRL